MKYILSAIAIYEIIFLVLGALKILEITISIGFVIGAMGWLFGLLWVLIAYQREEK